MKISDFKIGESFFCNRAEWRVTDIGTRTIIAVDLQAHKDDKSWYNGPPYAVVEEVFDQFDMQGCFKTLHEPHI